MTEKRLSSDSDWTLVEKEKSDLEKLENNFKNFQKKLRRRLLRWKRKVVFLNMK
uniref:Uncharacterized protein n=1 Tax=Meloidogyne enterolobii TaxID=390850 RepID=A0A6V7U9D2_MELEN|nr:unnamed protein product [Meloidogyne enterolobii]